MNGRIRVWLPLFLGLLGSNHLGAAPPDDAAAQAACQGLYDPGNGWKIEKCVTDPAVVTPMTVVLNGVSQGKAVLVRIYHKSQGAPRIPQVAIIYASGFVRLKQNADPVPAIPFGSSFILGPAYWSGPSTYHHNPQLAQLEIDTSWLPNNGPLRMRAQGTNQAFGITYDMELPPPRDRQTRLHVTQTHQAKANILIPPTRQALFEGFKLAQVSSMFINESGVCAGGSNGCHDSNGARYINNNLVMASVAFKNLTLPSFAFNAPLPLGSLWLDALHTDNSGWQGNTPNVRMALDAPPPGRTITPQGYLTATNNPNDDNVDLWLHDNGRASQTWAIGQQDQVSYWLFAQDNPPEPWRDLGLRGGLTFLNFESTQNCTVVLPSDRPVTGSVAPSAGYTGKAMQLRYNLGTGNGNWAQIRCNFNPPLNLSAHDHFRLDWRGSRGGGNSLQVGLINPKPGGGELIFARGYHHVSHRSWWGQLVIPFRFLSAWTPNTTFDPTRVSALFFSMVKDPTDDMGGLGSLAIDNLSAYNVRTRPTPPTFATVSTNQTASTKAANWLIQQQKPTGFVKSWQEETACAAYIYDQALALIVFAKEKRWLQANNIVAALAANQNPDGSWFQTYDCNTRAPRASNKWEGDIAWAVYALHRYLALGGTAGAARPALQKGAAWLVSRMNPTTGCLVIDHTEATIDAWWALQGAGSAYVNPANRLRQCLLRDYWDDSMGRFKGGKNWWQPYLDNQTWGAAFLNAIGEALKARRALSYAKQTLLAPSQGGQLFGFDGQAGPWSVWNEGTAQYVAARGEGANDLLLELLGQQRKDGAMPNSPDDFAGGGVWTSRWHGVAPTAWLYNALNGEPFRVASLR